MGTEPTTTARLVMNDFSEPNSCQASGPFEANAPALQTSSRCSPLKAARSSRLADKSALVPPHAPLSSSIQPVGSPAPDLTELLLEYFRL